MSVTGKTRPQLVCSKCARPTVSDIVKSRTAGLNVYRKRRCRACGARYSTLEAYETGDTTWGPRPVMEPESEALVSRRERVAAVKRAVDERSGK